MLIGSDLIKYVNICKEINAPKHISSIIYLTLPVTVATGERSFSKLKKLKYYLRNSIGQKRISNILVLNIEQCRTKEMDIEKIMTNF